MSARLLTRLGVPRLWNDDATVLWSYMRYFVQPVTLWLAPAAGYGVERVPREGGAVLAANHFSGIDHPLIGCFSPRPVHYFAKAELMSIPILGEILEWSDTVPVHRGRGDRDALRAAREAVSRGAFLGVHVEGTRQKFGHPGEVRSGGLMIAMQEGVPVVPCGVDTFGWSPTNRRLCAVVWGEPIDLGHLPRNRSGYGEAREIVGDEIVRLWRQAAEAAAAGLPEELPDGTKRSGPTAPGQPSPRD
ncbi:MAG: 1-acyl-sn-glycerol-3-phosphate acyltransferase [Actinomycetota bacterium]|nr:1-acyl-sn-glycerol-3-phosphate acyltransferase [Actinomycetota bacterium]